METRFSVYCGTYGKYNDGSLAGDWMTLADYDDLDDFYAACKELHKDEEDPEFMFQDIDGNDHGLYSECGISEKLFNICKAEDDIEASEEKCFSAFLDLFESEIDNDMDSSDIIDMFHEHYCGFFEDDYDFGVFCAEGMNIPAEVENYFDYAKYGRDCAYDFSEQDGYYFTNY